MYNTLTQNQQKGFTYEVEKLVDGLSSIIINSISPAVWDWLQDKASTASNISQFNAAFVLLPRKTGKLPIKISEEQQKSIDDIRKGFHIQGWTIDRLSRVWLILQLDPSDKERYFRSIENLFLTGEMNELVALYSALPVLPYPELWIPRCSEGIRSNIGDVLMAIICNNPYPAENLPDNAWNQLVMKAFFTDKPVNHIYGFDQRANPELTKILTDYAHERWAAHRPVNPLLWRGVGKFINEFNFADIEKAYHSGDEQEKKAVVLACNDSNYNKAQELLQKNEDWKKAIGNGTLSWEKIINHPKS